MKTQETIICYEDFNAALPQSFFERATVTVAREMLGQILVRVLENGEVLCGRIVETEAYGGSEDRASHASRGPTPRSAVMFGPPGHAYIYFIYGMYFCFNAVTESEGVAGAVLVRAIEPLQGVNFMQVNRPKTRDVYQLSNGPGKLCQVLKIDRTLNGCSLTTPNASLFLAPGHLPAAQEIETSPRIGLRADDPSREFPWRFTIRGNRFLSRKV